MVQRTDVFPFDATLREKKNQTKHTKRCGSCPKVLNPLDAVCNMPRPDAICVSNMRSAKKLDKAVLTERPDVKIFLPFRFYFYRVEELFTPNTYNKFLGEY